MYKATKSFSFNGIFYDEGDDVKIDNVDQLVLLNEKGFIGPLTPKEIQAFGKTKKEENNEEEI